MICAGNKLCCDRCGLELSSLKSREGTWEARCKDTASCQERQEDYRLMMREIVEGLAGNRVYVPRFAEGYPPQRYSRSDRNRETERAMAGTAFRARERKESIASGELEEERVARAERLAALDRQICRSAQV